MDTGRKFKKLDLKCKLSILKRLDLGESPSDLAREVGVTKSTISYLKKKRSSILQFAFSLEKTDGDFSKKTMLTPKDNVLEDAVYTWYRRTQSSGESVSGPMICQQALILNKKLGGSPSFKASTGWLMRFKQRHGIRQGSIVGEKVSSETNSLKHNMSACQLGDIDEDPIPCIPIKEEEINIKSQSSYDCPSLEVDRSNSPSTYTRPIELSTPQKSDCSGYVKLELPDRTTECSSPSTIPFISEYVNDPLQDEAQEDQYDIFGRYVASVIRSMKDPNLKIKVQNDILRAIIAGQEQLNTQ